MKRNLTIGATTFIVALLLVFKTNLRASHYSAGEIFYEWIGDEPGKDSLDYRVYATIYRNIGGAKIGTGDLSGCVFRSSTGFSTSISLQYQRSNVSLNPNYTISANNPYGWIDSGPHPMDSEGWDISVANDCGNSYRDISEYRYVGEVTLTGKHQDWKIAIFPLCCRDLNDNLAGGGNLYIEVDLNNINGPNSSPRFMASAVSNLCLWDSTVHSSPFSIDLRTREEDRDSILIRFDPNGSESGNSCNSATPIAYSGNFSSTRPIGSSPASYFNQANQSLHIYPSALGTFVLKFEAIEYRFDTVLNTWRNVGNTVREIPISVNGNCLPSIENWSLKDDPANTLKTLSCGDSLIKLAVPQKLQRSSVAPDGSDFSLLNSQSQLVPIQSARYRPLQSEIELQLRDTVSFNDTLALITRVGSDTNTIISSCSVSLPEFDTIMVITSGCPVDTSSGTSLAEAKFRSFRLFPNPTSNQVEIESALNGVPLEIKVFNTTGKFILGRQLPAYENKLNLETLASGTYILAIRGGAIRERHKLIINR